MTTNIWPIHITYDRTTAQLHVSFDNGETFALPAEYLRVESPSAEVQGHGAQIKQVVTGKKAVSITRIEPVGRYAVRLIFSDSHDSGLYSWPTLHHLGENYEAIWQVYLDALKRDGLLR